MSDDEAVSRRLRAVERSLTDGDHDLDALRDAGDLLERVESLESQLADAEDRIAELEAATQALRGYVGNVRSVNEDVEQRADAALATAERLEERLGDDAGEGRGVQRSGVPRREPDRRYEPTTGADAWDEESRPRTESDEGGGFLTSVRSVL